MRRWAFPLITTLLFTCCLYGQHYRVLHWGIEEGLSQGINQKIVQDAGGFLWISSFEGLNRFDGKTFRNFYNYPRKRNAIAGIETTGLVVDSTQKIWFGSGDGMNRYDPVTDSVMIFSPDLPAAGQSKYLVPVAATNKEVICFDINGKITAYQIHTLQRRTIASGIAWHSNYSNATNVWLNKKQQVLWMPAASGIAKISISSGETSFYLQHEIINTILYNGQAGAALLGTNNGLFQWDMKSDGLKRIAGLALAITGKINCLALGKLGETWVGTEEQGIFIINTDTSITHLQKSGNPLNALTGNKINSIYCDSSGIVWAGVGTNGIDQLVPSNGFTHYAEDGGTKNNLNNNIVRCFIEDNHNNLWIATQGGGINILHPATQQFSSLSKKNLRGLPFNAVRYMVRDEKHTAWIGTENGMCSIDMDKLVVSRILFADSNGRLLNDPYIEQIIPFKNNSWLIASREYGLCRLEKNAGTARQLAFPGNKHVFYTAFVNNLLFVSVWDDRPRIFSIKDERWTPVKKDITNFIITYVLADSSRNRYWIGTLQGLIETDANLNILHHYSTENGLSNNYVYAIVPDLRGYLWISTNKGLCRFDSSNGSFRIFTPDDGLQGYEYNAKAGYRDAKGNLYFGGINGFDMIHNSDEQTTVPPAAFYIKELLVNNIPYTGSKDINYTESITLPYTGNNITLQTGVVDFLTMGKNSIRYKLDGIDTGWKMADRNFLINYSGLPPGSYTFVAAAANSNNEWSKQQARIAIEITKPWWKNNWLRAGMAVMVIALLFSWIRAYFIGKLEKERRMLEKQKAVEHERTRIATDMHDDLGAALSRIKFLSETISIQEQRHEPVTNEINKIKLYSDEMIDKMGEIVWALNEKNDSLHDLVAYTRSYAVTYLSQQGLTCTANFPEQVPEIFVSGEFRRNVFLAIKETLHNIIRHAKATSVSISLAVTDELLIVIKDNGIGFNPAAVKPYSNGLSNIKTRMKNMGGSATIISENGVQWQLTIPLPQ